MSPRSRSQGDKCENGQAAFWYSQGCFIGCDKCDQASGRRQVDLCGLGKKQTLTDPKYWTVNRDAVPFSANDIYQHNPYAAGLPVTTGARATPRRCRTLQLLTRFSRAAARACGRASARAVC